MAIPEDTIAWLTGPDNPAIAVMTRREILSEAPSPDLTALWARRNEYAPVASILSGIPTVLAEETRDYQKYRGPLWQVHFLGELRADGADDRIRLLAEHAFSHQLDDGAWSVNGRQAGAIRCLTANVGRALARMGWAGDPRVVRALTQVAELVRDDEQLGCPAGGAAYTLNGYCHMLAPKLLLFLAEIPPDLWPGAAGAMRDECVRVLRAREVFRCLPTTAAEYAAVASKAKAADLPKVRRTWLDEHGPLEYGDKPGWLRFGYPLSYNSDVLEALAALAAIGEPARPEYEAALGVVRAAADDHMRWTMRNSFNGKMLADVERKGQPSKWLTVRAIRVLRHFDGESGPVSAAVNPESRRS